MKTLVFFEENQVQDSIPEFICMEDGLGWMGKGDYEKEANKQGKSAFFEEIEGKISELIDLSRKLDTEIILRNDDTTFQGYDGKSYDAIAGLEIYDGDFSIIYYNYWDDEMEEWIPTEEYGWDTQSIEKTFEIEVDVHEYK